MKKVKRITGIFKKNTERKSYMKASEPKWINSILNIYGGNSLRLEDLHIIFHKSVVNNSSFRLDISLFPVTALLYYHHEVNSLCLTCFFLRKSILRWFLIITDWHDELILIRSRFKDLQHIGITNFHHKLRYYEKTCCFLKCGWL